MPRGSVHRVAGDERAGRLDGPLLVLDVAWRQGIFVLVLENIGRDVAYRPRVEFSERLIGAGGDLEVSALPLWSRLSLLAPGRRVEAFLDVADAVLRSDCTSFTATVSFADVDGRKFRHDYEHDLTAYEGMPELATRPPSGTAWQPRP